MKKDNKKALYESIMSSVAREVKKTLNETVVDTEDNETETINYCLDEIKHCLYNGCDFTQYNKYIDSKKFYVITGCIYDCIQQASNIAKNLTTLAENSAVYKQNLNNSISMLEKCSNQLEDLDSLMRRLKRALNY